ncbi:hypothetical protein ACLOJK_041042 [Asimina triloba]
MRDSWLGPSRVAFLLALVSATTFCFWKSHHLRRRSKHGLSSSTPPNTNSNLLNKAGKIFFFSQTGTSKALSLRLSHLLSSHNLPFQLLDPSLYEPEDLPSESFILAVASTWEDGKPPPNALFLSRWLSDSASDFRVGSLLLSSCKFAVFGVGSRSYASDFNAAAKDFSHQMRALGALEILPLCQGDVDGGDLDEVFDQWSSRLVGVLKRYTGAEDGEFLIGSRLENKHMSEDEMFVGSEEDDDADVGQSEGVLVDLEDIAGKGPSRRGSSQKTAISTNGEQNGEKEMVTPIIRASLEKQVDEVTAPWSWGLLQALILWHRES